MKTLKEMKMLANFARMLGEPIDPTLLEAIEREEKYSKILFKEEQQEPESLGELVPVIESIPTLEPVILEQKEEAPKVAETGVSEIRGPNRENLIQQTANSLANIKLPSNKDETLAARMQKSEIDGIRKQIAGIISRLGTLSMGGGGTGVVRIFDTDDYLKSSGNDDRKFMTYRNGMFQMDFINPKQIVSNTAYVTSNTYQITNDDYYIGVNVASTVTITLPPAASVFTGHEFYIKDESGNAGSPARWIDIYPSGTDKIDNQNYVRLQIDNGGLKFIYRNGWRVI